VTVSLLPVMHNGPMSSGKFDPAYSFRSSDFNGTDSRKQQARTGARTTPALAAAPAEPVPHQRGQKLKAAKPSLLACPGPCNKRYQEAWKTYAAEVEDYNTTGLMDPSRSRPEEPEAAFWHGTPVWCAECTSKITLKLAQLDILAGILSAEADGHRPAAGTERVSGTSEPQSPSRAADDLEEMFAMLSTWETIYRDLKGWLSGPPRGELASRETECIDWLRRHRKGILMSVIAADFGLEVLQWHRESVATVKAGVRTLRKPMRCPSCRYAMLFWTEGEKNVYCKNDSCNRILSLTEYDDEVERQADALQRGDCEEAEDARGDAA
jgi:hypothetical protein